MARRFFGGRKIRGLSTDTKPTAPEDDAEFYETNTKKTFDWSGSAWVERTTPESSAITANTAKTGITSAQASAITANTAKISLTDNSVTLAKLAHGTADKVLGFDGSGNPAELTVGGGAEFHTFNSAGTFNPESQTGVMGITVVTPDPFDNGTVNVNVDGSSVKTISAGTPERFVTIETPSTSIAVVAEGDDVSGTSSTPVYTWNKSLWNHTALTGGIEKFEVHSSRSVWTSDDGKTYWGSNYDTTWRPYSLSAFFYATYQPSQHTNTSGVKDHTMLSGALIYYKVDANGTVSKGTAGSSWWTQSVTNYSTSSAFTSLVGTGNGHNITIKPDGTRLWVNGYQGTMTTANDLSTLSYDSKNWNIGTASRICWTDDGMNILKTQESDGIINQHAVSTAWDISTVNTTPMATFDTGFSSCLGCSIGHKNGSNTTLYANDSGYVKEWDMLMGFSAPIYVKVES